MDKTSTRASSWFGVLAGPLAWAMHEGLSYALVKVACSGGLLVLEHLVTVAMLAICAAGAYVSARSYLRYRRGDPTTPQGIERVGPEGTSGARAVDASASRSAPWGVVERVGPEGTSASHGDGDAVAVMAPLGLLTAALFAFAILMEAVPDLVLSPCL